jgi:hypothetical protein
MAVLQYLVGLVVLVLLVWGVVKVLTSFFE